jgi:hypothetical protein
VTVRRPGRRAQAARPKFDVARRFTGEGDGAGDEQSGKLRPSALSHRREILADPLPGYSRCVTPGAIAASGIRTMASSRTLGEDARLEHQPGCGFRPTQGSASYVTEATFVARNSGVETLRVRFQIVESRAILVRNATAECRWRATSHRVTVACVLDRARPGASPSVQRNLALRFPRCQRNRGSRRRRLGIGRAD